MNKRILKIAALALTMSMLSTTAARAMERPNAKNQGYLQRVIDYVKNIDYKYIALYGAGQAFSIPIAITIHESGHALMAELIMPGSVKHIEILSRTPHVLHYNPHNASLMQLIAISAAGPIAGAIGSYACAKSLQLFCSYQKKRGLLDAIEDTRNTPTQSSPSKSPFIRGLQYGLSCEIMNQGLIQMMAFPPQSDGLNIIRHIQDHSSINHYPIVILATIWNTILFQITRRHDMNATNEHTAHSYFTHLRKLMSHITIDGKKIVISPSILSNMILAQHYHDEDQFVGCNKVKDLLVLGLWYKAM